jgi:hypothetical protein
MRVTQFDVVYDARHRNSLLAFVIDETGTYPVLNGSAMRCADRGRDGNVCWRRSGLMRKYILPGLAAAALSIATPAMAYDSGGLMSMQAALDVATDIGLVAVSHTEFAGDEWQIEGRDYSGRYMEVDVDARTGDVLNVDRGW